MQKCEIVDVFDVGFVQFYDWHCRGLVDGRITVQVGDWVVLCYTAKFGRLFPYAMLDSIYASRDAAVDWACRCIRCEEAARRRRDTKFVFEYEVYHVVDDRMACERTQGHAGRRTCVGLGCPGICASGAVPTFVSYHNAGLSSMEDAVACMGAALWTKFPSKWLEAMWVVEWYFFDVRARGGRLIYPMGRFGTDPQAVYEVANGIAMVEGIDKVCVSLVVDGDERPLYFVCRDQVVF